MKDLNGLFAFIKKSPTAYHAVDSIKRELLLDGYTELFDAHEWKLCDGGKYFVAKNGSSIIAFRYNASANGFMICASHSDSPAFRVKSADSDNRDYARLSVEKYGGMICYSWLDRPLSIAGRAVVRTENGIKTELFNIDRDIAIIPSLSIHMNRGVNDGYKFNPAVDLLPIIGSSDSANSLLNEIGKCVGADSENIISTDSFLYNRDDGRVLGLRDEYISAPRLDDLECVYASLTAFLSADDTDSIPVLAVFDNEEVGSETKQGAASTFLSDVLSSVVGDKYKVMLNSSFMISADNAHAIHPNHPELSDKKNAPKINGGVVIKWNANQRYATDAVSDAIFKEIVVKSNVKTQDYYNRADMPGGSTLGSISNTRVSIPTIDIGLPQLAMHSAYETAGADDVFELIKALRAFFGSSIVRVGDNVTIK